MGRDDMGMASMSWDVMGRACMGRACMGRACMGRDGMGESSGCMAETSVKISPARKRTKTQYFTAKLNSSHLIYSLTARVVRAPQMISQCFLPFSLFSTALWDCRTPGLSIP